MNFIKNSIININYDIKILTEYSVLENEKAENSKGRIYLRVLGDHLELTLDKTQRATHRQINEYVKSIQKNIESDQNLNGPTEEGNELKRRLFKAFNKYLNCNIHDYSNDFEGIIEYSFNTISIPENNPFHGTDLVVIKDSFIGVVPLNGIKNKDFLEITNRITTLRQQGCVGSLVINTIYDKGLLAIRPDHCPCDEKYFKDELVNMIIKLCTRRQGRNLINDLIDQEIKIHILPIKSTDISFTPGSTNSVIWFNPDIYIELPTYNNEITPPFIALGHEFIHAWHYTQGDISHAFKVNTKISQISSLEEQETILGWGHKNYAPLSVTLGHQNNSIEEESENWDHDIEKSILAREKIINDLVKTYIEIADEKSQSQILNEINNIELDHYFAWKEICENGLRAAFGISPRKADHQNGKISSLKEKAFSLKKDFFLKMKCRRELRLDGLEFLAFTPVFVDLMTRTYGWQIFLNEALTHAYQTKSWDLIPELKRRGAENLSRIEWGNSIDRNFINAMIKEDKEMIQILIELGADISLQNLTIGEKVAKLKEIYLKEILYLSVSASSLTKMTNLIKEYKMLLPSIEMWNNFFIDLLNQLCHSKKWLWISALIICVKGYDQWEKLKHSWQKELDDTLKEYIEIKNNNITTLLHLGANPGPLLELNKDQLKELKISDGIVQKTLKKFQPPN